jgi:DNA-binding MarR family transcriptional regulator
VTARERTNDAVSAAAIRGTVRLSRAVEKVVAGFDLSVSQFRILDRLTDGAERGTRLADWLSVKPPSLTTLVDGLVRRGLVERAEDPTDRRRVTHTLTRGGRLVYDDVSAALAARLIELCERLPDPATADALIRALADWNAAFGDGSANPEPPT